MILMILYPDSHITTFRTFACTSGFFPTAYSHSRLPPLATSSSPVTIKSVIRGPLRKSLPVLIRSLLLLAVLMLAACERALFPPTAQRTPYERYQVLHGKHRPVSETNVYGGEQPALRQRLKPLDRP